ncbi:response regulator [Methylocapsa palsarum]|uniref:Sigma-B regulation protein RsbU (Phosphoserine phosphatase)/two-component system, cell cycle response regulator DivK n=1 Tax=Methylocapsa palsarum TaxID=1612308 RepID=A0A1I4CDP7_9HYPH|nr:response regulator [Methylocapsa palsarum]SFK78286.1 sigma-B regulation protein RsbU (phosphoserine phosphatase)/two-component system, cell cycle response regulator DivK [Methylocapsa palsarum]
MTQRILVVEDTYDNRQILRDLLTSAGFEFLEAVDGEKGVQMAATCRPDLILMDIQLPGLDGFAAIGKIKGDLELKDIPVIGVSSHANSDDAAKALQAGFSAYVTKPFSPRALLARVRELLSNEG